MRQGRGIRYTGELTVNAEESLTPVYPYSIRTSRFADSYDEFNVLDEHDSVVHKGLLRTRNFQFSNHNGKHFLVFVSRSDHRDPERDPWAVFGFLQVNLTLNPQNLSD